ncbi:MAG: universal stress protein [FCB group bacterium]|nr:universal stress protein [FCB group bacterium]
MRFLLAIKDTSSESRNTLKIAATIAQGFHADISVVYTGPKARGMIANEVAMAQKSLNDWNIHHPGIGVLQWAYESLQELGFIPEDEGGFSPGNLIEESGRIRMVLPQYSGEKIRLILREGNLLTELKKESEFRSYELAIIGASNSKRRIHQLIQFIDTSVLVVRNFNPDWNYKILLCVDDSKATKRAVIFGARTAKQFNAHVNMITVSKRKSFGKGYLNASKWGNKYLSLQKIPHTVSLVSGNPTDIFCKKAGTDHIIVMGKGTKNEFLKFFLGSKPIHTAQRAKCPVLIVRPFKEKS